MSSSSPPVIAIISAGAMGAGLAARLTAAGCTVLTELAGRSPATRARAIAAGMTDASLEEICSRAQWILSVLPPSDARALAERCAAAGARRFADCNAVSPETTREIATLFKEGKGREDVIYVDGGIIGGPPKDAYNPVLYLSASPADEENGVLVELDGLKTYGLPVRTLPGAGIGGASALKMSYSGIMKGLSGLLITMILSAHADAPATANALLEQLSDSGAFLLARSEFSLRDSQPKAYRFVGEMEEIASFIDKRLGTAQTGGGPGRIFDGMASVYTRLAESVAQGSGDVDVLNDWIDKVRKMREGSGA